MLFNSLDFAVFLPITFLIYWFLLKDKLKLQNLFIVFSSFVFYAWWDWRFLGLIVLSSSIDFILGLSLSKEENKIKRKLFLAISLTANLGLLAFFKYFNFFVENFIEAFTLLGYSFSPVSLSIILPVGVSFYTFQTMSYSIDVYRRKLEPTKDLVSFLAFVSFFPQLVAGPIERATNLLPQFYTKRTFNKLQAIDGMRQILWGFFKKLVIADNCAEYVNLIFHNNSEHTGSSLLLAAVLFAFQIYCDFSGYSDIAIGVSRLFGFNLMQNFAFPYFSRDIAEFWRRWHISLSTWFRDYLYIPLGGSKQTTMKKIRNTFIVFLVSGFWHGANWTFIAWGTINALLFIPLLLAGTNRNHTGPISPNKFLPSLPDFARICLTFLLTTLAWVFFRSASIEESISILSKIFSLSVISAPMFIPKTTVILVAVFVVIEWSGRMHSHCLQLVASIKSGAFRWSVYYIIILAILLFGNFIENEFIYFQF